MFKTNLAILKLCSEKILDGDYLDLVEIGFTAEDINALAEFNPLDIQKAAKDLDGSMFVLKINDQGSLSKSIQKIKAAHERKKLALELIKLGASSEMMRQVAGMNNKIYAATKKALGLQQDTGGRPRTITEEEARIVWLYFNDKQFTHPRLLTLKDWLELCTTTNVGADIAYRAIFTWFEEESSRGHL